jgi:ribosomal-protein-alanine N-acetyltransferase
MTAVERFETERLIIRRPVAADAEAIFQCYAGDPQVTRYVSWACHRTVHDTRQFLKFSDVQWAQWPAGPLLIETTEDHRLIGGTGLAYESPDVATTGYVLGKHAWGCGFATEALQGVVQLATRLGLRALRARCHPFHVVSQRVLEKNGFIREEEPRPANFPNLSAGESREALYYTLQLHA